MVYKQGPDPIKTSLFVVLIHPKASAVAAQTLRTESCALEDRENLADSQVLTSV